MASKAVFLDRDGTINVDKDYVYRLEDLEFLPNTIKGLKTIQEKGYMLIIITNQSGIGRGYYSEEDYHLFMKGFYKLLQKEGVKIEADYYCKHAPEDKCDCRKPETKLIEKAIKEHDIDVENSYIIGDKTADILTGKKAGLKTILVKTGKAGLDKEYDVKADFVCDNLLEASDALK